MHVYAPHKLNRGIGPLVSLPIMYHHQQLHILVFLMIRVVFKSKTDYEVKWRYSNIK